MQLVQVAVVVEQSRQGERHWSQAVPLSRWAAMQPVHAVALPEQVEHGEVQSRQTVPLKYWWDAQRMQVFPGARL